MKARSASGCLCQPRRWPGPADPNVSAPGLSGRSVVRSQSVVPLKPEDYDWSSADGVIRGKLASPPDLTQFRVPPKAGGQIDLFG